MRGILPLALGIAIAAVGCVPRYRPPSAEEPHAVVKLRRVYSTRPGPTLREFITVNEQAAFQRTSQPLEAPSTDAVLVHPGPAAWALSATFFHTETRREQESYQEREPYQDHETYNCGTFDRPRTCSRSVTKYRYQTKHRWVNKQVEVVDDRCTASVQHDAKEGAAYIVQLTYQGSGVCHGSCFLQSKGAEGELTQQPCP